MTKTMKVDETSICVWLDNRLMRSEDYIDAQDQLRTLYKAFQSFKDSDQCVDFITDLTDSKIFFITSNILGKLLVPLIHSCEQIDTIWIFHSNKRADETWTKQYRKIKRIVQDVKLISGSFEQDTKTTAKDDRDPIAISFLASGDVISRDLNRQDPSFMYFQLLKDIILNDHLLESEEETRADMVIYCQKVYADDPCALDILEQFEKDFIPELAIYWYTRECFLHKMLNKALWTPQPDVLYKLRYFLRHLYYQLLSQASTQREHRSSIIVYRGQSMPSEQIERLKKGIGGFVSFNNFLSTSLKEDVALNFLWGSENGVLFEMHIDPTIEKCPFVNIEQISYLQKEECEQELLFAMGSVFRIVRVDKEDNYYRVQLVLSGDVDEQLAVYTKLTREQTRSFHSFWSLLKLMNELSEYSYIDRFAEILNDDDIGLPSNPMFLAPIHHLFGTIYLSRSQHKESLEHFHKALNLNLNFLAADHLSLTPTYNNIGCVYLAQGDYDKALQFQQLALDCQLKSESADPSSIITYRNNIAKVYTQQEKYTEAIAEHKRALELQLQFLGENDPSLKETYNLISSVYRSQGDHQQAAFYRERTNALKHAAPELDPSASADDIIRTGKVCLSQGQYQEAIIHLNRALEIQQQYFLPNNPSLATTHNLIASAYYKQEQYEESLPYYKKALEIEESALPDDHPSIETSYYNISTAYVGLSRWSEAIGYALKAVALLKKTLQTDVNTLATFVHHVGHIYHEQEQFEEALLYYAEAIELYRTHLSDNDPSLFVVYHRTARTYYHFDKYSEALDLYQKALNIALKILPDNARQTATIYMDISATSMGLTRFDEALLAAEQAIEQLQKTLPYNHPEVVQYRVHLDTVKQRQIAHNGYH